MLAHPPPPHSATNTILCPWSLSLLACIPVYPPTPLHCLQSYLQSLLAHALTLFPFLRFHILITGLYLHVAPLSLTAPYPQLLCNFSNFIALPSFQMFNISFWYHFPSI